MNKLHHVSMMSYHIDADKKQTRIAIYAADKVFSKGGKLTARASIPASLNGYKLPSLKEAQAILRGDSIIEAVEALPEGWEQDLAAKPAAPAPVLSQFRVTFKRWGEVVHTAVVSVEHRYQALDTAANEHCAKVRDGKAEAFIYDTHTVDAIEPEQTGPHEEAWDYKSGGELEAARHAIDCARQQVSGSLEGARLTLDYPSVEQGYVFIMHANVGGLSMRHTLAAKVTDVKRLCMHWAGFVENVRAELVKMSKEG